MKQLFKILMMAVFATAFIACNDDLSLIHI